MRKVLLFLLLFGSGLALLWWLGQSTAPSSETEEPLVGDLETTPSPEGTASLSIDGSFEATHYDPVSRQALLHVKSEESRTEVDVDFFDRVDIELLDPATGELQARVHSARARLQRRKDSVSLPPKHENFVSLTEIDAEFLTGVPIAPLRVHAPEAFLDATDPSRRRLVSRANVRFQAPELRGEGLGAVVELDRGIIELAQSAWVELKDPAGRLARLSSLGPGPMQVRREGAPGQQTLVVEVWEGASLSLSGEPTSSLLADHVVIRATPPETTQPLQLRALDADGSVSWDHGGNEFQGGRVAMEFRPDGELEVARLEEFPSARIVLSGEEILAGIQPSESQLVQLRSENILELRRVEEDMRFVLGGPATIETQDARLRSNGDVTGSLTGDRRRSTFRADRGVVLEGSGARLETAVFSLDIEVMSEDRLKLHGVAEEGSRLVGTLKDGRPFSLTSPGRLEVVREGEALRVVEGEGVELAVEGLAEGPGPLHARADRVLDFELETQRFLARGHVVFESDEGRSSGDELRVEGPGRYTLSARAPARARLENAQGWAEADIVDVEGDRIHAYGSVTAQLSHGFDQLAFDRYDLSCEDLVLTRAERDAEEPPRERTFRLEARGAVRSLVVLGPEQSAIRCERLDVEREERFEDPALLSPSEARTILHASEVEEARLEGERGKLSLSCEQLDIERNESPAREAEQTVRAEGSVHFQADARIAVRGSGDVLTIDADRTAHLEAPSTGRILLEGSLPARKLSFQLEADRADVFADHIEARLPEIRARDWRARAERLRATETSLELEENVSVTGETKAGESWTLEAGYLRLEGLAGEEMSWADLQEFRARQDVRFHLGTAVVARGNELSSSQPGILRLEGTPARIEAPYIEYEAEWIEFDPALRIVVSTGRGWMRPRSISARGQETGPWTLEFLSSSTLIEPDSLIYVLQEPYFRYPQFDATMRASWSVLWVDRLRWQELYEELGKREITAGPPPPPLDQVPMRRLFGFLEQRNIPDVIREIYFEGPVEALYGADQVAHCDAFYLDLASGHGWLANTTVSIPGRLVGQDFDRLIVKADWLRHSADGSLQADSATLTPCSFDEPHLKLVTGDLRITPVLVEGKPRFEFTLRDNRVEFYDRYKIPLFPISFYTDESLKSVFWESLRIGDSARVGFLLGIRLSGPARWLGRLSDRMFGRAPDKKEEERAQEEEQAEARPPSARPEADANYQVSASYLGSRGGLLDVGLTIESPDEHWLDLFTAGVLDSGKDRGFIRVPEEDRSDLRTWIRSHGWLKRGRNRWSLVYSDQSDYGVQSEFFESEFLAYEEDESYLQWKRADGALYAQTSLQPRVESFRTDIEELPSASIYRGRAPLFELGPYSVVHTGEVRADYLRRREGGVTTFDEDGDGFPDPLQSPFGLPARFPDGLGEREVLRFDTRQQFETPIALPMALRLIPFVGARLTAWDEAVDPDESATRFVTEGGARIATTLWKNLEGGRMHQIAPYLELRADLTSDLEEPVVPYDSVERAVFGDFIELGARSRFFVREGQSAFDLDLRGIWAADRSDGGNDGWLPLEVFGRLALEPLGLPLDAWQDLRYDIEEGEAVYSLSSIGTRFSDRFGLQVGYQVGRDAALVKLFDAATVAGFYRWTEKWEFEARQTYSFLEDQRLDLNVLLRRYGHDAVFELETAIREGEGTSIGFNVAPLLGFRRSRIGYLTW